MIPFFSLPGFIQMLIYLALGCGCIFAVDFVGARVFRFWDTKDAYDPGPVTKFIRGALFVAAFFAGPFLILLLLENAGILA